jgi:hypothetical protein
MIECQQRQAASAELERLLPGREQRLTDLGLATAHVLAAVVTLEREAFVQRVRESANWSTSARGSNG